MLEKVSYPEPIKEALEKYILILDNEKFFDDEIEFPPNMQETAKTHLWNLLGNILMPKFIDGSDDYQATADELNEVIKLTIIQTNLDSLIQDKLVDTLEDENGETIYFVTEKGKELAKDIGKDVDNLE